MTDTTEVIRNMSASDLVTSALAESLRKTQKYIQILYFERRLKMRLVHYFIYNTKTLKKVANFGTNRAKAVEELAKLNNTECYALGYKWFNL